jgi:uncharacterized protein (DUF885 family)
MKTFSQTRLTLITALFVLVLSGCEKATPLNDETANDPAAVVNAIADRYYTSTLEQMPEVAYFSGIELDRHDTLEDISPESLKARQVASRDMLQQLEAVDATALVGQTEWITHAYLLQELKSSVAQQVCRSELWNVSQMNGWHLGYSQIAQLQPTGTPLLRQQSMTRWSGLSDYIDQNIKNLEQGLELGYSAPQSVVQRVITQVDGVLSLETEQSPFFSPASRDDDKEFIAATRDIVEGQIVPALQRYRDFLANTYAGSARKELSVTANPNGRECYEASLQAYTTLDRSGREVFELGEKTVAANKTTVIELGEAAYELSDFKEIIDAAKADPADRFTTKEALLEFSRASVLNAEAEMPNWVGSMPAQVVSVVPFAEHEEGTGMSAHYRPGSPDRPAEYRIPLHEPEERSRGNAESTAFHEAWPGHHLQVAVGQSREGLHPITQIIWFSGPGEGWARYAEGLAEEMDLYVTRTGPIQRRAWPARGMVVDPGIHLFGWTREQAKEFMLESGRFPSTLGDEMVDRIAVLPGQLTAYDSGGLEILALRAEAQQALGDDFDIREFHDRILENGTIPLVQLRVHMEAWISEFENREH